MSVQHSYCDMANYVDWLTSMLDIFIPSQATLLEIFLATLLNATSLQKTLFYRTLKDVKCCERKAKYIYQDTVQ